MPSNDAVELTSDELSYFDTLDMDSASDDPFKHELGTFEFTVTSAKKARGKEKADGTQSLGLVFTFGSDQGEVTMWRNIPRPGGAISPQRQLSYERQFLSQIGVIPEDHARVYNALVKYDDDSAVVGLEVVAEVINDGDYQKLVKIHPKGIKGTRVGAAQVSSSIDDTWE
jgi:hypothetical protein